MVVTSENKLPVLIIIRVSNTSEYHIFNQSYFPLLTPFFLRLRKPEVAEKYLAFASSARRSDADGFTISKP
jgi:hypothetical protein